MFRLVTPQEAAMFRREVLGVSQQFLADCIGVAKMTVSKWERGVLDLPYDYPMRLIALVELEHDRTQLHGNPEHYRAAALRRIHRSLSEIPAPNGNGK